MYSILVVALFLSTELYPFLAALDDEVLLAMSAADDVARGGSGDSVVDVGQGQGRGRGREERFQAQEAG